MSFPSIDSPYRTSSASTTQFYAYLSAARNKFLHQRSSTNTTAPPLAYTNNPTIGSSAISIPYCRLSPQQGSPIVGSDLSRALPLTADEEYLTYSQASMAIQAITAWNLVESRLPEAEAITNTSDEARTISGDTEGIPTLVLEKIVAAVRFNNRTSLTLPLVNSDVAHP
jgi:hypothetical protein